MLHRLLVVLMLSLCASVATAQTAGVPLSLLQISSQAQSDPEAAIAAIDTAMSDPEQRDQRTLFDLLLLKAETLEALGQQADAGQLYLQLGQLAARNRDVLGWDPVTLYDRAAARFLAADAPKAAEAALTLIVAETRDGGGSSDDVAAVFDRIAAMWRAAGEAARADSFEQRAVKVRNDTAPTRKADDTAGFREVEVFYATDRARSGETAPAAFYGGERGDLELGVAMVTIPDAHEAGVLEAPSIWRLEFAPNPAKHVVLKSVTPVGQDVFFGQMNNTLNTMGSSDAFVFVHGYNVRFDAAAKRAAQMAYDMNFPGVPILYSWPSRGSTVGYIADTAVVRLSGRRLSGFLDDLLNQSEATNIHIVAHSMGNRALTDALELLALRRNLGPETEPLFDQVLFAAPDLDAQLFSAMMPVIRPVAKRLTLYASNQDWALATSKQLHGNAPRAGQGGETMLAAPEVDSIDMSQLGEDMMAHSYFADDSSALADIVALFWRNAAPEVRCGLQRRGPDQTQTVEMWEYVAGSCEDRALVEVMAHLREAKVTDAKTAERVLSEKVPNAEMVETLTPIVSKLFDKP